VLPGEINPEILADILQRFINQKILSPISLFYLTVRMTDPIIPDTLPGH
jgi:hypothetical protein